MTHSPWLEARVAALVSKLADQAPLDVDPVTIARDAATSPRARVFGSQLDGLNRGLVVSFLVLAMLATMVGGAVIAGGRVLPRDPVDVLTGQSVVEPFIGLPPEGAAPSTPEAGDLVLRFYGRPRSINLDFHSMSVFADGRLIWTRNLDWESGFQAGVVSAAERAQALQVSQAAFGGTKPTTGVIEQRLTPQGIDLLRETVLSSGLFGIRPARLDGPDTDSSNPGVLWGGLAMEQDGRIVRAQWSDHRLPARLADPEKWLPSSAWSDKRITGFVASRYAMCLGVWGSAPPVAPEAILRLLPTDVRALIDSRVNPLDAPIKADSRCHHQVTTEDARAIAAGLEAAGLPQVQGATHLLGYHVRTGAGTTLEDQPVIFFEPMLPDGAVVCDCG